MFIDFFTCVHFIMADREDEATPQVVHRQTIIHTYCTFGLFPIPGIVFIVVKNITVIGPKPIHLQWKCMIVLCVRDFSKCTIAACCVDVVNEGSRLVTLIFSRHPQRD